MRKLAVLLVALSSLAGHLVAEAPPVEFGLAEFRQAVEDRGLRPIRINTEIGTGAPETYRITGYRIQGGDLRGLMYGLLAAADQIRRLGRLGPESGDPAIPVRGVRRFLNIADLDPGGRYGLDYWRDYVQMLARNRFNRLTVTFGYPSPYPAPVLPYLTGVEEWPEIRPRGLSGQQRERNLAMLCDIAQTAADHAIDFTLGIWRPDDHVHPELSPVEGFTSGIAGAYTSRALAVVLSACPAIRGVELEPGGESQPLDVFNEDVLDVFRHAGRRVTLDLHRASAAGHFLDAAAESEVPLRFVEPFAEGRLAWPFASPDSVVAGLRPGDRHGVLWSLRAPDSEPPFAWGDPDYVRRVVPTLTLSGSQGFEIEVPVPAADAPSADGYEFERQWLCYRLWGRLTYDPKAPDRVWMADLEQRFGDAAADVLEARRQASRARSEIAAAHWTPPGRNGLENSIDYYLSAPSGAPRYIASIEEAAADQVSGRASAKQVPDETAARLREFAAAIDAAVDRADRLLGADHAGWLETKPGLEASSLLARFHAYRLVGAERLAVFYRTADRAALEQARSELSNAAEAWDQLASMPNALVPAGSSAGMRRVLKADAEVLEEREWMLDRFGSFDYGFDFGPTARAGLEPRFVAGTLGAYDEARGFGWVSEEPRPEVATTDAPPGGLESQLFRDFIRGHTPKTFRVRTGDGEFLVSLLTPDGNATTAPRTPVNGVVDVPMPGGEWELSGIIVKRVQPAPAAAVGPVPVRPPRPAITHRPPVTVREDSSLALRLLVAPAAAAARVRLHYRSAGAPGEFRTIEQEGGQAAFEIPGEQLGADWNLVYYFEVLAPGGSGWFYPDPHEQTPYYVLPVAAQVSSR